MHVLSFAGGSYFSKNLWEDMTFDEMIDLLVKPVSKFRRVIRILIIVEELAHKFLNKEELRKALSVIHRLSAQNEIYKYDCQITLAKISANFSFTHLKREQEGRPA